MLIKVKNIDILLKHVYSIDISPKHIYKFKKYKYINYFSMQK